MKKAYLLSLPVLALVAVAGIAAAFPMGNIEEMTQEEKDLKVQMLELKQEMTGNRIAYLKGELTDEQFQERFQAHLDEAQPLREQLRELHSNGEGCACGGGMKMGRMGFGPGMRGF